MRQPAPGRGNRARCSVLGLAMLCLCCALPAQGQQTVDIRGQVQTNEGRVIPFGITVRLETGEGMLVGQRPANSNGQFEFENIQKTPHRVIITADGFEPVQRDLDLGRAANEVYLNIFLTPLSKTKTNPEVLPSRTDQQAPKDARKEHERGLEALKHNKLSQAQTHFEKAVEVYPCYARALTDLALVQSARGDNPSAEKALRKAVECDPDFIDAYAQLGWVLNAEKKYSDSLAVLQEGVRRSPASWQFYFQLGVADYGLGQYSKAEEEYLKARSLLKTPSPELYVKLADVYLKERAFNKAYTEMQGYLRAEPEGRFAPKIRELIKRMESAGLLSASQTPAPQPDPADR
jgi:tetratricopeptide (TPR) repeat protein